jgi:hypothetical protein
MIDLDAMMQARAGEGWGSATSDRAWFSPDAIVQAIKQLDGQVQMERETLKRMWAAVAATPAGRHVLEHLMAEYVLKQSFDINLAGQSVDQIALYGVWRDSQRHLVNTILGLAGAGLKATQASMEQAHGRPDSSGSDSRPNGIRFGFLPDADAEPDSGSAGQDSEVT